MFCFNKKDVSDNATPVKDGIKDNTDEKSIDEWIWMDGYKGTDIDMKCRGFGYKLHKQYNIDGEVKECENGFHLCRELNEVFGWYPLNGNTRFFKVKALVRKEDYDNYYRCRGIGFITTDPYYEPKRKIAAKSIIFEEEIAYSSGLKEYIHNKYKFIDTEQEYIQLRNTKYEHFREKKFINTFKGLGYSELFANILYDEKVKRSNVDSWLFDMMKKAKAFKEEGVSKELSIYLLLK